jgi:predicted nucleic acid-binding protein
MTQEPQWLIDKSAYAQLGHSADEEDWAQRITRGLVQVTTATLLEIGFSARSAEDWSRSVEAPPASHLPVAHLTPAIERRALEVQGILSRRDQHRAPSVPDLLVAATAELSGLVVLHVDKDFELIAEITGQETERLRVSQ